MSSVMFGENPMNEKSGKENIRRAEEDGNFLLRSFNFHKRVQMCTSVGAEFVRIQKQQEGLSLKPFQ